MVQNSKTRYVRASVNEFRQKLLSCCFEVFLRLWVQVEAPAFWGRRELPYVHILLDQAGELVPGKARFPRARALKNKDMRKTPTVVDAIP